MEPKPINNLPLDLRYIYTAVEIEALALMCANYAKAEVEEGLDEVLSKTEVMKKIDERVHEIVQQNIQKKIDCKETTTHTASFLDARMQMYCVDPINEVLSVHHELMYVRYLFNELIISDEKFTALINEECFKKAREFAAEQMRIKFPLVNQVAKEMVENAPEEPKPAEEPAKETAE